jgi:hypothetical protein
MDGARSGLVVLATMTVALLAGASSSAAQSEGGSRWSGRVGGGLGIHGTCTDCDADPVGGSMVLGVEYSTSPEWGFGLSWSSVWLGGKLTGLGRHSLSLDATRSLGRSRPYLRVSLGTAVSTTVDIDGPPDPPDLGDVVIGIGDTQGLSGALGLGWRTRAGPLTLAPEASLIGQRVAGTTITVATVVLQLVIG